MAPKQQQITYIELPAAKIEATKQFYSLAFGWEWTDYGPSYAAYEGNAIEVGLNAAALAAPQHAPQAQDSIGPLILFQSDNLTTIEKQVAAAGGEIISTIYPYPGGQRFHFMDPSGNILGVYQSDQSDHAGPP